MSPTEQETPQQENFKFDQKQREKLFARYNYSMRKIIVRMATQDGTKDSGNYLRPVLSAYSLNEAFEDIEQDIDFLIKRRLSSGVSFGKIAGVFFFRLGRSHIIHLTDDFKDKKEYLRLNVLIAYFFTVKFILKTDIDDIHTLDGQNLSKELVFLVKKRHLNQEQLGFVFDIINNKHTKPEKMKFSSK